MYHVKLRCVTYIICKTCEYNEMQIKVNKIMLKIKTYLLNIQYVELCCIVLHNKFPNWITRGFLKMKIERNKIMLQILIYLLDHTFHIIFLLALNEAWKTHLRFQKLFACLPKLSWKNCHMLFAPFSNICLFLLPSSLTLISILDNTQI